MIFIVEPTKKSIDVFNHFYENMKNLNQKYGLNQYVLMNKSSSGDLDYVKKFIDKEKILEILPFDENMKKFEQGERYALQNFVKDNFQIFEKIKEKLISYKRN